MSCGWHEVDSELSMRFPVIFKHLYKTKTANDFFISGDSGYLTFLAWVDPAIRLVG